MDPKIRPGCSRLVQFENITVFTMNFYGTDVSTGRVIETFSKNLDLVYLVNQDV